MSEWNTAGPQIGVYIDFDNIVMSRYNELHGARSFRDDGAGARNPSVLVQQRLREARLDIAAVLDFAASFGTVAIRRAYADWSNAVNAGYGTDLMRSSVDLVQMFPLSGTKNGADIRLAIDVIDDLTRYPHLAQVLIVAGDSDYVPLAQRCRRLGRRVIGIGAARSVGVFWEAACDEFRYYGSVPTVTAAGAPRIMSAPRIVSAPPTVSTPPSVSAPPAAGGSKQTHDPDSRGLLIRAARLVHEKAGGEWVTASGLKNRMKQLNPAFDEATTGFPNFTAFLRSHDRLVDVQPTSSGTFVHLRERGEVVALPAAGSAPRKPA